MDIYVVFLGRYCVCVSEVFFRCFKYVKERKSPGPDGIGGRILKNCAEQSAEIFSFIFMWSLELQNVPNIWKESIIVPEPKNKTLKSHNDYRPVALTSLVMKCFEKIVLHELLTQVTDKLDPLQFVYRSGRGVADALETLLNF